MVLCNIWIKTTKSEACLECQSVTWRTKWYMTHIGNINSLASELGTSNCKSLFLSKCFISHYFWCIVVILCTYVIGAILFPLQISCYFSRLSYFFLNLACHAVNDWFSSFHLQKLTALPWLVCYFIQVFPSEFSWQYRCCLLMQARISWLSLCLVQIALKLRFL